jgi:site-specific recombinase XerD
MVSRHTQSPSSTNENMSVPEPSSSRGRSRGGKGVTQARASAQRTKLDVQAHEKQEAVHSPAEEKHQAGQTKNRKNVTVARAIQDYIDDHEGGNHSDKTIEWHQTALGFLQTYLQHEREITVITGIDAPDISAWFASMRKTPGARGKIRSERTIQTYARSARAFFHWLVRQNLPATPFADLLLPSGENGLPHPLEPEEWEYLLLACHSPKETGVIANQAAARNRAILWVLFETGMHVTEVCRLCLGDMDREQGMVRAGKG